MIHITEPILTWYTRVDDSADFIPTEEKYLGTYTARKNIAVRIQLWNNRFGIEDVKDLKNFSVKVFFQDAEDSSLLKYLTFEDKDGNTIEMENFGKFILVKFPNDFTLEGKANNGITNENKKNYTEFKIVFNAPETTQLKEGDLKNIYLEVISN